MGRTETIGPLPAAIGAAVLIGVALLAFAFLFPRIEATTVAFIGGEAALEGRCGPAEAG